MDGNSGEIASAIANIESLLKGIPSGAWVAISERQNKVLSYGDDAQTVLDEAESTGEAHPLIVRVRDQASLLAR